MVKWRREVIVLLNSPLPKRMFPGSEDVHFGPSETRGVGTRGVVWAPVRVVSEGVPRHTSFSYEPSSFYRTGVDTTIYFL